MKDYIEWSKTKAKINNYHHRPIKFRPRQIWWCSIGENIGNEEDGKGETFLRPVLIVKRLSPKIFFGIPLTSKSKPDDNHHYFKIEFRNKNNWLLLSQVRCWDSLRLINKLGELDNETFWQIRQTLGEYLSLIYPQK